MVFTQKHKYKSNTHTNIKRILDNNLETMKCCDTPPLEPNEVFNVLDDYTWKYIFDYLNYSNYSVDNVNLYTTCKRWYEIINVNRIKITNFKTLEDVIKNDDVYSLSFINPVDQRFRLFVMCELAAKYGKMNCLQWAHENSYKWNGCRWSQIICATAAINGHLDCLKYAHENNCPLNSNTCTYAAINGHLDCLKYAHENNCPLNSNTCTYAATNGHLDCLKYAHENNCPLNSNTCTYAAINGHLDCLKYAHENNCPLNSNTCTYAAINGHLDCLKYAHENNCP